MPSTLQRLISAKLSFCMLLVAASISNLSQSQAEALSPVAASLLSDVQKLADDEWQGRGVGTPGLTAAGDYIAQKFAAYGLNVTVAGGDAYQEFNINDGAELGDQNSLRFIDTEGQAIELEFSKEFQPCSFGGSGQFQAPVIFAGYGIEADDAEYNDYSEMDVKGKVVVVMRRNPKQSDPHGPFAVGHGISRHASLTTKLSRAFSNGAIAVIFVSDPHTTKTEYDQLAAQVEKAKQKLTDAQQAGNDEQIDIAKRHLKEVEKMLAEHVSDPLMEFGYGGTRSGKSLPTFHITQSACNELLKKSLGKTLEEIEQTIDETGQPFTRELSGWQAAGEASISVNEVPVRNVVGVLEGEGPFREETIVIGAHYDHLGMGGDGSMLPGAKEVHNGADDNASGTAGLLELARRFGSMETPPQRRLVFIAFTGEERGLLGSEKYVEEPLFPLEKTVAMFNMDMIGRLEEDRLTVFGTGTAERWGDLLDPLAERYQLTLAKKPEGFGPSDHSSFYAKKVPVLHLFTGTHSDYHRPSDDWDKINAVGMARIVNFLDDVVQDTLNREQAPQYIAISGRANIQRDGRRPYFGSIPNFGTDAEGYAIQGASPGSPADKAGLKGGDVIIKLGNKKIGSLDDFDLALRAFSPGEQVKVVVMRDGQEVPLDVTLAAPRE